MIHILLWMALGAVTYRLLTRTPKEDPTMGGRIVPRGYVLDTAAMAAENARRQREHGARVQRTHDVMEAAYQREVARTPAERDRRRRVFGVGA